MKCFSRIVVAVLFCNVGLVTSFGVTHRLTAKAAPPSTATVSKSTVLSMAKKDDDLLRAARSSRSAGSDDNLVELMRPLGMILNQDDAGNVYVETLAPKGNAARTGKVRSSVVVGSYSVAPSTCWHTTDSDYHRW